MKIHRGRPFEKSLQDGNRLFTHKQVTGGRRPGEKLIKHGSE
jgi:hypothetical protein